MKFGWNNKMFKKLMARFKSPQIQGEVAEPQLEQQRWIKSYDVILENMEGSPAYPLSHQLSIGSEIGNIIIADPSVSPRHATILLQEEVISIIDHGSVNGTFVNGIKIPSGKFIILEETDQIMVGELQVKIGVKTTLVEDTEFIPPEHEHLITNESEVPEESPEEEIEESDEDVEEIDEEDDDDASTSGTSTKTKFYSGKSKEAPTGKEKKDKQKKKFSLSFPSYDATNALIRVFALTADFLLSYIIILVFLPFDDLRSLLYSIPEILEEEFQFKWAYLWISLTEEIPTVTEVLSEIYGMVNEIIPVFPLLMMFFVLRLISTVIFGVSISEYIFGIRANFNRIWSRIGGLFRVIVGMITGPFFIFDLPALASKRTFKEFITFTNTFVASRVMTFVGIVLYLPLLLVGLLIAPMIIGLELVEPIPFNSTVSQRVKPKVQEGEVPVVQKISDTSRFMGFTLNYDPQLYSVTPSFRFKGEKSKLNMNISVNLYMRETDRFVSIELFKIFNPKELIKVGLQGNFLLHDQYQSLYNYAYAATPAKKSAKKETSVKQDEMFGMDVIAFTEMAFGLGLDNLVDFMTTKTPLLKSVVDYRAALLGLFEYKDYSDISIVKLGKVLCFKVSYDGQKPFDLIVPLRKDDGRIYKITYDSKVEIGKQRNTLYKYALDELTWGVQKKENESETLQSFEVIDLFTQDFSRFALTSENAQALYGYYFEKSAEILKAGKVSEFQLWKDSVKAMINIIPHLKEEKPEPIPEVVTDTEVETLPEPLPETPVTDIDINTEVTTDVPSEIVPEVIDSPKEKLRSNFLDLQNALENMNKSYFGIEEQPTV